MKIMNLTQHRSTAEQVKAGVFDSLHGEYIRNLLTFKKPPTGKVVADRALELACLAFTVCNDARDHEGEPMFAMIGGAPFLMGPLEHALKEQGITPLYAFSERVSEEATAPCGAVTKINVFKHVAFVGAQSQSSV